MAASNKSSLKTHTGEEQPDYTVDAFARFKEIFTKVLKMCNDGCDEQAVGLLNREAIMFVLMDKDNKIQMGDGDLANCLIILRQKESGKWRYASSLLGGPLGLRKFNSYMEMIVDANVPDGGENDCRKKANTLARDMATGDINDDAVTNVAHLITTGELDEDVDQEARKDIDECVFAEDALDTTISDDADGEGIIAEAAGVVSYEYIKDILKKGGDAEAAAEEIVEHFRNKVTLVYSAQLITLYSAFRCSIYSRQEGNGSSTLVEEYCADGGGITIQCLDMLNVETKGKDTVVSVSSEMYMGGFPPTITQMADEKGWVATGTTFKNNPANVLETLYALYMLLIMFFHAENKPHIITPTELAGHFNKVMKAIGLIIGQMAWDPFVVPNSEELAKIPAIMGLSHEGFATARKSLVKYTSDDAKRMGKRMYSDVEGNLIAKVGDKIIKFHHPGTKIYGRFSSDRLL